ncbi:MAG: hypothetical protein ACYCOU_02025 [Sulfobacillus sp.]
MSEILDAAKQVVASQLAAALIAKNANSPSTTTEEIQAAIKIYDSVLEEMRKRPPLKISKEVLDKARGKR